jgi:hypothetical protein
MTTLQELFEEKTKFHSTGGALISYATHPEALGYIDKYVDNSSKTVETGAGLSTVIFALKGATHICITPDPGEVERITTYCRTKQISLDKVQFVIERSEKALPKLEVDNLDLVLIDGFHAFPTPFIDWYYLVEKLKVGGRIIIDDTSLWTSNILREFMLSEPEWQLDEEGIQEYATFILLQEEKHTKWHGLQEFVVKRSGSEMKRLFLDGVFIAYFSGDFNNGNEKLREVLDKFPELKINVEELSQELVSRIWQHFTTNTFDESELVHFTETVCNQISTIVPDKKVKRSTVSKVWEALAFHYHQQREARKVISCGMKALFLDPNRLRNRGLLSILFRALFRVYPYNR